MTTLKVMKINKKMNDWRALLEECSKEYRIVNDSDYSGVAWIIEWNE